MAALAGWLLAGGGTSLAGAEPGTWQRKHQAQQQARAAAEALVADVLSVQLQQLEENGLAALPVYREIAEVQSHLTRIARQEMDEIAGLLARLEQASFAEQEALQTALRGKIREVVAGLLAERQRIYRRLKVAHLAADVRQLLDRQSQTQAATSVLAGAEASQRPARALTVREDQADVHKLYYQLVATLQDVRSWGGPAADGATRGLSLLKVAQVDATLQAIAQALAQADFPAAARHQQAVLDALAMLLRELESAQGLEAAGREAALALVRELVAKQQELRQRTRQTVSSPHEASLLADPQAALHRQLAPLAALLRRFPEALPLAQAAREAALAAARELFEERPEPAARQQAEVLAHLVHLQDFLAAEDDQATDRSADALAEEIGRLEQLQAALRPLGNALPEAAADGSAVAAWTEGLAALRPLAEPGPPTVALQRAQVEEQAQRWQRHAEQAASPEVRQAAAEQTRRAVLQLEAELSSALADLKRRERAVAVGELARAAETLERAAATQREIARRLAGADPALLRPEAARTAEAFLIDQEPPLSLADEQRQVAAVARKVAEGVRRTAPPAQRQLSALAEALQGLAEQLATREAAGEPAATAPTELAVGAVAADAQARSAELAEVAALLRRAQGQAAATLGELARSQREQVASARQQVEQARPADDPAASQDLEGWQATAAALRQARVLATRAAGRNQQATVQELADQLAEVRSLQQRAEAAAEALAAGQTEDPLSAATAQQWVADQLRQMAAVPSPLRESLQQAAQHAGLVGRALLYGRWQEAEHARRALLESLNQAGDALPPWREQAAQLPAGPPDPRAWQELAELLQRTAEALPASAQAPAGEDGAALPQLLRDAATIARNPPSASMAPSSFAPLEAALSQAESGVQAALKAAVRQQRELLNRHAAALAAAQPSAARADAGAAAALAQAAAQVQREKAGQTAATPAQTLSQVQSKWEQAHASLLAREGRLRRDEELAHLLASLALAQQAARQTITQTSQQLEQAPPTGQQPDAPEPPPAAAQTAERQELAHALLQAQHQFAFAQTVTGQAAVEVSGQVEVANRPLREALQLASQLRLPGPPPGIGDPGGEGPARPGETHRDAAGQASTLAGPPADRRDAAPRAVPGSTAPTRGSSEGTSGPPSDPASTDRGLVRGPSGGERALGTQLVPASPQVTAEQIAGPQAQAAAAAAQAGGPGQTGQGPSGQQGQGSQGSGSAPSEGAASTTARRGGAVRQGTATPNTPPPQGALEVAEAAQADSRGQATAEGTAVPEGPFRASAETWMARLPPELRAAIQARGRRPPPRGYEERLQRYFESVP